MNKELFKKNARRVMLLITVMGLSACDLMSSPERITFLDNQFAVTKPASWSLRDDLNDEADLQMANLFKEAYMVVLSESKEDFDDITLEEHGDLTKSLMKDGLENYQESKPEYIGGNKYKTMRHIISGQTEGLDIIYWHVTIETKEHFHQMLFWSLASTFEKNADTYTSVIQSFEVIN